jgi:hypothetical protein
VIVMAHGVTDIGLSWSTLIWELEGSYDISDHRKSFEAEELDMNLEKVTLAALSCLFGLAPAAAGAHHSFAVHYEPDKTQVIEGAARSFRFTNPHGILLLEVTNEAGRSTSRGCTNPLRSP